MVTVMVESLPEFTHPPLDDVNMSIPEYRVLVLQPHPVHVLLLLLLLLVLGQLVLPEEFLDETLHFSVLAEELKQSEMIKKCSLMMRVGDDNLSSCNILALLIV